MTVRLVGGGGARSWVLRMTGPGSGMMSVSSPLACVRGGALAGGGGGASAGGKVTRLCACVAWDTRRSIINDRQNCKLQIANCKLQIANLQWFLPIRIISGIPPAWE